MSARKPSPSTLLSLLAAPAGFVILMVSVDLFLVVCVVALVVWLLVVVDQRDESSAEAADLLFDNAGLKARLDDLLDEHSRCPAPVRIPAQREAGDLS